jgi:hypothetical protein
MSEHQGTPRAGCRQWLKALAFIGEDDMPGFAALALANEHGSGIQVEVARAQTAQLAIAAAGKERRLGEIPEIALRGIYQPGDFIFRKITKPRRVYPTKWLDGAPRDVRCSVAIAESLV